MKCVRDSTVPLSTRTNKGYMLSGSSMGYDSHRCQANIATGGKEHQRYRSCGEQMVLKNDEYVCPIHGVMH